MPYWINLMAAAIAFAVSAVLGIYLIPLLKKLHFGTTIYEKGPAWHKSKNGTPLMGGFMFIIGTILATAAAYCVWRFVCPQSAVVPDNNGLYKLLAGLGYAILNGVIGFIDDYIKAVKKQNKGLDAKQKMIMQFAASVMFLEVLRLLGDTSTEIIIPFAGKVDFGFFYYI